MAIISVAEPLSGALRIRPAQPGEDDIVLDLLAEAAAWLHGRGIAQWPARFPAGSVRTRITTGAALLVEDGPRPMATLTVDEDDAELWGTDTAPAFYLSRLAVARHASGAHLGYRLIEWVSDKAAERGWQYVRLATASNNPALRRYYEHIGFEHVADPPHARWPTSLYQREVHPT